MHLSIALLLTAPLAVLAGPMREDTRAVKQPSHQVPTWAQRFDGKCTSTKFATKTVTSTRRVTRHPRPTTTTIYVVKTVKKTTTLPPITNVFSTTSTLYTTSTATASATETESWTITATRDVAPSTSYIAAPPNFTPIRSVYPKDAAPSKRSELDARHKQPAKPPVCLKPGDLKCRTTVRKTVTKHTATRYVTSTATAHRVTFTKKRTSTLTTTVSVLPTPASSTATFSTTITAMETSTSTFIETVSSTTSYDVTRGPTPTAYAACGPENILDTYNGRYVDTLNFANTANDGGAISLGYQPSAYDCCVACIDNAQCAGAGYLGGTCLGLKPNVRCSADLVSGTFGASSERDPGWRVSNGVCGQWRPATF